MQVGKDQKKLTKVQIIKGMFKDDRLHETVVTVADDEAGRDTICLTWQDKTFDTSEPAYWYARELETPTPRWSKLLCEHADLCEQFPEADKMLAEQAWSSPIWQLP